MSEEIVKECMKAELKARGYTEDIPEKMTQAELKDLIEGARHGSRTDIRRLSCEVGYMTDIVPEAEPWENILESRLHTNDV